MNFINLNLVVQTHTQNEYLLTANAEGWGMVNAPSRAPNGMLDARLRNRGDAEHLGELLFATLFPAPVADYYRRLREVAIQSNRALRLRLTLDPLAAQLPWEYVCDPQTKQFLAFDPHLSIVRHPPTGRALPRIAASLPLKILALVSQPRDFELLDAPRERANLEQALGDLLQQGSAHVTWLEPATPEALRDAIAVRDYHVLHFIGHGGFHQRTEESGIILTHPDGYSAHLSSTDLAMLTFSRDPLRVVILNACATGASNAQDAFSSVAATLVQKGGVAAVVAMQTQITDNASIGFTRGFYQMLARGNSLDDAMREGRKAIYTTGNVAEWGTPVLYLHATDGELIALAENEDELPRLEAIPDVPRLFGREQELEMYRAMLESTNRVIIEGMAGVGKTTLGAALARAQQAQGRRVFWISFDAASKNNGELFVWELAGFLKRNGKPQLWDALKQEATSSERNAVRRFTLLVNSLQGENFTLCFDDLHLVLDDPIINQLFSSIQKQYQDHPEQLPAQFIVMTRRVPTYMEHLSGEPLAGLTLDEMRAWLNAEGIQLSVSHSRRLYDKVQGNPHFVRLAMTGLARYLQDAAALDRRIDDLESQSNVHDYLMAQVYETLAPPEKWLLDALCIFDAFVPVEAVKQISVGEPINNVARRLRELARRNVIFEKHETQEFGLHALVRHWCYENLDSDLQKRLNEKAGTYFETQREFVKAAHHFMQAAKYARAAQDLTENADELMGRGNLDTLVKMMSELLDKSLPQSLYLKSVYTLALGLAALGIDKRAISLLEQVVALSDDELQIQALISLAESMRVLGEFAKANEILRRATRLLAQDTNAELSARAFEGLGWTEYRLGNLDAAEVALQKALEMAERCGRTLLVAHARLRLGQVLQERGQFEKAYELELESLREFQEAGHVRNQADAYLALGYSCGARGSFAEAESFYRQAIQILERVEDDYGIMMGLNDLGDLLRTEGKFSEAMPLLERAAALAENGNYKYMVVFIGLSFAELCFDQNLFADARVHAETAIARAREWKYETLEALGSRILGNVYAALFEREQALANYQRAVFLTERVGSASEKLAAYQELGVYLDKDGCDMLQKALLIAQAIQAPQQVTTLATLIAERCRVNEK